MKNSVDTASRLMGAFNIAGASLLIVSGVQYDSNYRSLGGLTSIVGSSVALSFGEKKLRLSFALTGAAGLFFVLSGFYSSNFSEIFGGLCVIAGIISKYLGKDTLARNFLLASTLSVGFQAIEPMLSGLPLDQPRLAAFGFYATSNIVSKYARLGEDKRALVLKV